MSPTVDALLPLSLLEAVRDVDTPQGDFEAEFVPELRNKRLGLSETVYAQIRRYAESVRRNQRAESDEVMALARLIGRRPDAEAVFRSAGRFLAYEAYRTISPVTRRLLLVPPSMLGRPPAPFPHPGFPVPPPATMLSLSSLSAIQSALADANLDGWLLYDFRGVNAIARAMVGLGDEMATRRWFVFVPRVGVPTAITHGIE